MQFTEQQKAFIKQYAEFEKKYGKGNVFIRYVNDFWKCRFIVHHKGDFGFTQLDPQIHERVVTSLQKRGVIKSYDIHHNVVDANDRSVTLVGGRIDLSKIKGGISMRNEEIIAKVKDLIEACNEEIRYDKKYGNVTRVQIAEGKRDVLLKLLNEIK